MLFAKEDHVTSIDEQLFMEMNSHGNSQFNSVGSESDDSRGLLTSYGHRYPLDRQSRTVDDPLSLKYNQQRLKRSTNNDDSKEYTNIPTSIVFGGSRSASDFLKCCIGSLEDGMTKAIQMSLIVAQRRVYGGGRRAFQIYRSNEFIDPMNFKVYANFGSFLYFMMKCLVWD